MVAQKKAGSIYFFHYSYSKAARQEVLTLCRNNESWYGSSWTELLSTAIERYKGHKFCARMGMVGLAASIYCMWQERNQIIFQCNYRSSEICMRVIEDYIKACAWRWKVDRTYCN